MVDGPPRAATDSGRPLFALGVLTLPFENFWFAPSRGWAAIAPLLFFAYVAWNVRRVPSSVVRLKRVFRVVLALVVLSACRWTAHPPPAETLLDAARSLVLGLSFLVALDLRFGRGEDPDPTLRALGVAYLAGLALGLLQWAAIRFGWDSLIELHRSLAMRDVVRRGRIQFGFTEPAFAAMHVFGVMLPLLVHFRGRRAARPLLAAFVGFVAVALLTRFSLRFVVDGLVVAALAAAVWTVRKRPPVAKVALTAVALAALGVFAVKSVPRLERIVTRGVYADESLAARWFRVRAVLAAWRDDPVALLFGYGLGNLWVPVRAGHEEARAVYASSYDDEVVLLQTRRATSVLSMPVRLAAEFGLLATLVLAVLLFDRRRPFRSLVVMFVYLTFDSYAFYAGWLHLHLGRHGRAPPSDGVAPDGPVVMGGRSAGAGSPPAPAIR